MTKTLTEQWKDGELPVGSYYINLVGDVERVDFFDGLEWERTKDFGIEEVLAPVPSYDENKRLQERNEKLEKMAFQYTPEEWNTMLRTIERLQEQLAIATKALKEYADRTNWIEGNFMCVYDGKCFADEESAEQALKEMEGVK